MDAALRLALDRHGLFVEAVGLDNLRRSVQLTAPDLVLLLGDAAEQGGVAALSVLAGDASSAAVPVDTTDVSNPSARSTIVSISARALSSSTTRMRPLNRPLSLAGSLLSTPDLHATPQ